MRLTLILRLVTLHQTKFIWGRSLHNQIEKFSRAIVWFTVQRSCRAIEIFCRRNFSAGWWSWKDLPIRQNGKLLVLVLIHFCWHFWVSSVAVIYILRRENFVNTSLLLYCRRKVSDYRERELKISSIFLLNCAKIYFLALHFIRVLATMAEWIG